jgi:hypothetical protein
MWVKRSDVEAQQCLASVEDGAAYVLWKFNTSEYFEWRGETGAARFITNRVFRDPAAWYHVVVKCDTTQSVEADRFKIFFNGVQETSFSTETYPTLNSDTYVNKSGGTFRIGADEVPGSYFNGVMAHVHLTDGTAYDASAFGEFDATSGIWVAKTSPSVTYGTNGFFLKYASGALGTDSSGEGNTFTVSGTMTTTKDTPDNNFCTMNPLDNFYAGDTFSNGNTTATTSTAYGYSRCTQSLSTGKWYWEIKATTIAATDYTIGIASKPSLSATDWVGSTSESYSYVATDGKIYTSAAGTAYGDTYSAGDIIGVYLDLDNNKLYFAKNGIVQNSGTGYSITASASTTDGVYASAIGAWSGTGGNVFDGNFGNGYFGTTAVTSAVADEGGIGQFEYDPSSGTFDGSSKDFRAICTNNIATYG